MVRRIASQVHQQAARLLRANYLTQEPVWYKAVLEHPPIPLPSRGPASRTKYDLPPQTGHAPSHPKAPKSKPLPIVYIEDQIRRQFFRDHPFEAFRPRTLVERDQVDDEHPIKGLSWVRLSQRGRTPQPEDAIKFAVNMHTTHQLSLPRAYAAAVFQYRSLRSEHHMATLVAVAEAEHYGAQFGELEVDKIHKEEQEHLSSWDTDPESARASSEARKRWKAVVERRNGGSWTKGTEYVRLWKEGVRPNYIVDLSAEKDNKPLEPPTKPTKPNRPIHRRARS